jgi:predicted nucleic acid-binding protein
VSITLDLLESATHISVQHSILTNDALIIAGMQQFGLTHLVTNDDDFDNIPDLSVWKPR